MRCAGTDHALAGPENGSVVALLSEATASSHPMSSAAVGVDWQYGKWYMYRHYQAMGRMSLTPAFLYHIVAQTRVAEVRDSVPSGTVTRAA